MFPRRYAPPVVIAEIGCNHKGDMAIAKELINLAKQGKAHVAKFQKRHPAELLTPEQYNAPHPNPGCAYGPTYGLHREFLEFSLEQHAELKQYCERRGIIYSTSVWDVTSARQIVTLQPVLLKVPSATNNNLELLRILRDDYAGEVHVSMGMTTHAEEKQVIEFFEKTNVARSRLVIYACTSGYPVPAKDMALLEIRRLHDQYEARVKGIGFSSHHSGIALDIAAYTLGAHWIERHFTKDRTWKGTDHAASLEPPGLCKLTRDLVEAHQALRFKSKQILDIEAPQRRKLKYGG